MTATRRRNTDRHSDARAMAATGGGKIRSRRYHIASKPYAKSKQQQSGLISRVTDTVKSIVPSWLQKYFKNGDDPEGEGSVQGTEQNCQPPPPPPPAPNGSEEGPPSFDSSAINTEPSASRASLNFQEYVLSRPPLSRSHLHFSPLEASSPTLGAPSSLFSQPSTSSAPGPFSTGFSLVKEIKDNLSQHDDDNISTTSGFSSRASDKDVPTSKTASLPQLWSPETDRSSSGPQPSQSNLKKPAFNLSVFGTSSNSTLNSTVLNTSQLGDSPFYPGKTTYGGAAAVRSSRTRPGTPYQAPVRRQIKAKPAGAQPCGVTSATARRILQSLERMSSPLADARRIPAVSHSPLSASMDSTNLDVSPFQAKKKRLDSTLPPVQKLVVPTASLSGNRSVSFRPTLTPGGVSRTLDRIPRETPTRQSPQLPEATPGPSQSTIGSSGPSYPLSSTPASSSVSSGGGKMKRERTTARPSSKRPEDDEVAEIPDLPTISLPISTSALPTFSFSSPLPPLTTATTDSITSLVTPLTPPKETLTNKETPTVSPPTSVPFTFSSPIVKATPASPPSFSPSAGFTFSVPVAKLCPSMSNGKPATSIVAPVKPAAVKSTEDFEGPFKPAKTLKQGSVLDLLKAPGFAAAAQTSSGPDDAPQQSLAESTAPSFTSTTTSSAGFGDLFKPPPGWSCDVCLVQNKPSDTKCVCCMAPQPSSSSFKSTDSKPPTTSAGPESSSSTNSSSSTSSTTTGFGAMFSRPTGTWDCDTCLVINKPDAVKCVACETAKPGTGLKALPTLPSAFSAVKTVSSPTAPFSSGFIGFGDKFKKTEGALECDTGLVQKKAEDTKSVTSTAAETGASPEPSAAGSSQTSSAPVLDLLEKFKKPEGSWECDVCMVQNKAADVQCVACQTVKPGAKVEPRAVGSSFGSSTSGGFKFGSSDSSSGSGGFKFGGSLSEKSSSSSSSSSSGGFKFGISFGGSSSETTSKDNKASLGFTFGTSSEGVKFGTAPADGKKSEQPAAGSGFKFGTSGGIVFGTGSSNPSESTSSKGTFTFGFSKPADKTSDTTTTSTSSSVTFTPPAFSQEKDNSVTSSQDTASTNTTTSATTTGSLFGSLASTTPPGGATFGSLSTEKEPSAPTVPSAFLFGAASKDVPAAPTAASSGGLAFSNPSAQTPQPPPTFTFGKPAVKSGTSTPEPPKPTLTFGQSASDSDAAPKQTFNFLATNSTSAMSSASTLSLFGGSSSTQAPTSSVAPSTFIFGQPAAASSSTAPASTFVFGQNQDSQAPAPPPAPVNSAPAQPSFNFGAAAPSAASSAAASTVPSTFVFNSTPSGGFGANATPSFGSSFGSPFPAAPSQTPAFGATPNAAPVFGQQTNSTPVFGAAANSAAGGASQFRGAGAFGASTNSTGVFTFGAASAAPPAASANPSVPQSVAPGGGFNFSQPPTFNMGATKSFSASPAGQQTTAGRKIKTAVRRRK